MIEMTLIPSMVLVGPNSASADFGPFTPGTTTAGIQEAINSVAPGGANQYLPIWIKGTTTYYSVSSPISITNPTEIRWEPNAEVRGTSALGANLFTISSGGKGSLLLFPYLTRTGYTTNNYLLVLNADEVLVIGGLLKDSWYGMNVGGSKCVMLGTRFQNMQTSPPYDNSGLGNRFDFIQWVRPRIELHDEFSNAKDNQNSLFYLDDSVLAPTPGQEPVGLHVKTNTTGQSGIDVDVLGRGDGVFIALNSGTIWGLNCQTYGTPYAGGNGAFINFIETGGFGQHFLVATIKEYVSGHTSFSGDILRIFNVDKTQFIRRITNTGKETIWFDGSPYAAGAIDITVPSSTIHDRPLLWCKIPGGKTLNVGINSFTIKSSLLTGTNPGSLIKCHKQKNFFNQTSPPTNYDLDIEAHDNSSTNANEIAVRIRSPATFTISTYYDVIFALEIVN